MTTLKASDKFCRVTTNGAASVVMYSPVKIPGKTVMVINDTTQLGTTTVTTAAGNINGSSSLPLVGAGAWAILVADGANYKAFLPSSGGVPSTRALTGSGAIKIAGDNAAHDLSADRTISVADAAAGVKGVIELDTDLGGTAAAVVVAQLSGVANSVAVLAATHLDWASGGPSIAQGGNTSKGLKLSVTTANESFSFYDGANLIGALNWNASSSYFQVGSTAAGFQFLANAGTNQYIRFLVGGTTPAGVQFAAASIQFMMASTAVKGNWNDTGLRVGDGTGAAEKLEVAGTGLFTGELKLGSPFLSFQAAAVAPLVSHVSANVDGWDMTLLAQGGGSGTNKAGGRLVAQGGPGTGTGIQGGFNALLGSGERLLQVVSLAGAAGVSTKSVVALCRKTAVTLTQCPDGDGMVFIGDATVVPVTQPVSGCYVYSKAGRPTFWGSNTGPAAKELSLINTFGGAINLVALGTSTDSLNVFFDGTNYRIPLI